MALKIGRHTYSIVNSSYPVDPDILPGNIPMSDTFHTSPSQVAEDLKNIVATHFPPPSAEDQGQPHVFGAFGLDYKSLALQLAKAVLPLAIQALLNKLPAGINIDTAAFSAAVLVELEKLLS